MPSSPGDNAALLFAAPDQHKRVLFNEFRRRAFELIRLRWFVPPIIVVGVIGARLLGFEFDAWTLLGVGIFILGYNLVFAMLQQRLNREPDEEGIWTFTYWQLGLDYLSLFLVIHSTGGMGSPLCWFFIFHIIYSSILLPALYAYGFCAIAVFGVGLIGLAEQLNWLDGHAIYFHGEVVGISPQPINQLVHLVFFAATVLVTAMSITGIMRVLRTRMVALDQSTGAVLNLNDKLRALYLMVEAVGSKKNLEQILDIVKKELVRQMDVTAISVKLLSEDEKTLSYAASYGLPETMVKDKVIELEKSPINRKILDGQPFVNGKLSQQDMFQFGEELSQAGIQSVLFVPLKAEGKITGILGAYGTEENRFNEEDVDFFALAGGLIAIVIENARAYESIAQLIEERSRFMMRVAHNLRAPCAATISILNVVRDGHLGELNAEQQEYLRRVDRRARGMVAMISELMLLAKSRTDKKKANMVPVDMQWLAERVQRTFKDDAQQAGLEISFAIPPMLPKVKGDPNMLEEMMENLVSNAIKYTKKGTVRVSMTPLPDDILLIEVRDSGIGISKEDLARLFTEFFRAENAKALEEIGTGLGLAIVQETVKQHGGEIDVDSELGRGTVFRVRLPVLKQEHYGWQEYWPEMGQQS